MSHPRALSSRQQNALNKHRKRLNYLKCNIIFSSDIETFILCLDRGLIRMRPTRNLGLNIKRGLNLLNRGELN